MSLLNDFLKSLTMPVGDLAKWLYEEHQVPVNDTIAKWNSLTGMKITIEEDVVNCEEVADQTITIKNKNQNVNNIQLDPKLCQHLFIAGKRRNQQCTTKPKGGNDRCSAHKAKPKAKTSPITSPKVASKKKKAYYSNEEEDAESEAEVEKKDAPESDDEEKEPEVPVKKSPQKSVFDTDSEEEEEPKVEKKKKKAIKKSSPKKKVSYTSESEGEISQSD
jgi:hypothetical protein